MTYLAVIGLPPLATLPFHDGCEGSGLSARLMLSTKCARYEAKVDAKITTSSPDILGKGDEVNKDGQRFLLKLSYYLLSSFFYSLFVVISCLPKPRLSLGFRFPVCSFSHGISVPRLYPLPPD